MSKFRTYKIHLNGRVQGVGFRPFVYRLALESGIKGRILNGSDGVHIELTADEEHAMRFYYRILSEAPAVAHIAYHDIRQTGAKFFENFEISQSGHTGAKAAKLAPDFGICKACLAELYHPENRRSGYAFITCTDCGPRASVIQGIPYDRANTTMKAFHMCGTCRSEYENPADRRFYSQTNSCPECGIQLALYNEAAHELPHPLETVTDLLKEGAILAVKGIGGYLLMCNAANEKAVANLRKRKNRPGKPFAVLFPGTGDLEAHFLLSHEEKALLEGAVSPIVLLRMKEDAACPIALDLIAPGLKHLGVMLPYAPLLSLIVTRFGAPLVATSANISGSPILFDDAGIQQALSGVADYWLIHNRAIVMPQDDSVVKLAPRSGQKIILRRSRGLAPNYWHSDSLLKKSDDVWALGADMKSSFSMQSGQNMLVSQYLGEMSDYDTQENFIRTIENYASIFETRPQILLSDKHPGYFSTQLAFRLSEEKGSKHIQVQHHVAHFCAVLGEHELFGSTAPILGVIWDGTGYGDDGHIWGGEFFVFNNQSFIRIAHFDYFPVILADKMAKEPRISALCLCNDLADADTALRPVFSPAEWQLYHKLLRQDGLPMTSSAGRLFDGVAALLGLSGVQQYEGEAAMLLEQCALLWFEQSGYRFSEAYVAENEAGPGIPTRVIIGRILHDLNEQQPAGYVAAKFHNTLIVLIKNAALSGGCKKIAFSGGVFQNALLVDLIRLRLSAGFELYFHEQLSANDENISFGQLCWYNHVAATEQDSDLKI